MIKESWGEHVFDFDDYNDEDTKEVSEPVPSVKSVKKYKDGFRTWLQVITCIANVYSIDMSFAKICYSLPLHLRVTFGRIHKTARPVREPQ
jgi:hypothetical protein